MTVWIALLRAVNLGARNKVPMAALRSLLADAGLPGARTHLQSGNVIVNTDISDPAAIIREVVRAHFAVDEPVMIRSLTRLTEIVAANPFPEAAETRPTLLRVIFLDEHPAPERVRHLEERDDARVLDREVYLDYRTHVHGNPLNSAMVARRLGLRGTERNWTTIGQTLKIAQNLISYEETTALADPRDPIAAQGRDAPLA
jgi:uncharacterized protein (DUF1697 family)